MFFFILFFFLTFECSGLPVQCHWVEYSPRHWSFHQHKGWVLNGWNFNFGRTFPFNVVRLFQIGAIIRLIGANPSCWQLSVNYSARNGVSPGTNCFHSADHHLYVTCLESLWHRVCVGCFFFCHTVMSLKSRSLLLNVIFIKMTPHEHFFFKYNNDIFQSFGLAYPHCHKDGPVWHQSHLIQTLE